MSKKSQPVEVWAPGCECGDCDGLLGLTVEDDSGKVSHPTPVFLSRHDAERWLTDWARPKLGRKRARIVAAKLVRKVDPEEMARDDAIYCPEGHLHEWDEWHLAATAQMN